MSRKVRISVVMPSYNQVDYLREAIESVLSQGRHLHELIVLDGGSTDGSSDIIRSCESNISYWRSHRDDGQTAAIREGFERSTGDVLCWLNSDDVFLPNALDRVGTAFERHPSAEIVSGFMVYIDEQSRITECPRVITGHSVLGRMGVVNVNQQATFFSRRVYEQVGGVDANLHCAMDMDLWSKFHLSGSRWLHIPTYLAAFRKHSEQKGSGGPWWDRYQEEKAEVRSRYPSLYGGPARQKLGLMLYRAMQIASGRHLAGITSTRRYAGRSLAEAHSL